MNIQAFLHLLLAVQVPQTTAERTNYAATSTNAEVGAFLDSLDRKSTRLNSSHDQISYAVFCLKKKKRQPDSRIAANTTPFTSIQAHREEAGLSPAQTARQGPTTTTKDRVVCCAFPRVHVNELP